MSITDRALLVDLKLHAWGGTKTDREATDSVAETFEARKTVGSYSKKLLPAEAFREVYRVWNITVNEHNRRTLPWADSGARVIASVNWLDYSGKIKSLKTDWEVAVDNFCDNYADMIESQKTALGKMFHQEDYPTVAEVRGKFGFDLRIMPVPDGEDFRVEVDEADELRKEIDAHTKAATNAAMTELADRISHSVSHMVGVLEKADTKSNVLRDSLVENLRTLTNLLPGMNLTNDPIITEVTKAIKDKLCVLDGSSLRSDPQARDTAKSEADKILEKMKGFYQ